VPTPYFAKIPLIGYDIEDSGEKIAVANILQRIKLRELVLNDRMIYYTYTVKDGETPEIIADKLYGSSFFHWVVLLANNIVDPTYDWPLSHEDLMLTIQKKYGTPEQDGLVYAYQTVHHYEDMSGNWIDEETYRSLPYVERREVMIYDYEVAQNDAKRQIQLLDKNFVAALDVEADKIQKRALV